MSRILSLALILQLIFNLSASDAFALQSENANNLAVFDEVWRTIRERYYDADLRGVDWEAQRKEFRPRAAEAADKQTLYRILREMLGTLKDSHTRVFVPGENTDWKTPRVVNVGLAAREIENQLIVVKVEDKSQADKAGVRVGARLTKIGDAAANAVFEQKVGEKRGASTQAIARLQSAASLFEGEAGTSVNVCWENEKSKERCAALRREWRTIKSDLRVRRENNVLIIGFDVFTLETVSRALGVLRQNLGKARGIVLDLRANRGGATDASVDFASVFLPEKTNIGAFFDRNGRVVQEAQTRQFPLFIVNSVKITEISVVVLTGTATASSAEIFVAALKNAGRARVIGSQTCGCVLAVRGEHRLPDGGTLEISELDFKLTSGARLEGTGIAPDETVELTRRDILARRDLALERALASFKK